MENNHFVKVGTYAFDSNDIRLFGVDAKQKKIIKFEHKDGHVTNMKFPNEEEAEVALAELFDNLCFNSSANDDAEDEENDEVETPDE